MIRSFLGPLAACVATALLSCSLAVTRAAHLELYGVNYNIRKGPDWAPPAEKCKTQSDVDLDFATIAAITKRVRIYSLTDCDQGALVLASAQHHGLAVELGLWVNADPSVFEAEKMRFVTLLATASATASSGTTTARITSELVTAIHVGSEAVYRKEVTIAQIIAYMREIKTITTTAGLAIPVSIADIGDVYLAHPDLVDAVDFISANGFPFWEKTAVEEAANHFYDRMAPLMEIAVTKSKDFVISETGWASGGSHVNASAANPGNASQYLADFHALATQHQWKYYYFEAFDEPWKLALANEQNHNSTVEAYFGIFNSDRSLKAEYASLNFTDNATPAPTPTPTTTTTPTLTPSPSPSSSSSASPSTEATEAVEAPSRLDCSVSA